MSAGAVLSCSRRFPLHREVVASFRFPQRVKVEGNRVFLPTMACGSPGAGIVGRTAHATVIRQADTAGTSPCQTDVEMEGTYAPEGYGGGYSPGGAVRGSI